MLEITGRLASSGNGLEMNLYEDVPDSEELPQTYALERGNGLLHVVKMIHDPRDMSAGIGYVKVDESTQDGHSQMEYKLYPDMLEKYGRKSIMFTAARAIIPTAIERDRTLALIDFLIEADNQRSSGLARKLGAEFVTSDGGTDLYSLSVAVFEHAQRKRLLQHA